MDGPSEYEALKAEAHEAYANAKAVASPALGERVAFLAEGFNHILLTGSRRPRERASQIARFRLLPRAIRLVGHANTFQEFEERTKDVEVRRRKHRERQTKVVRYWGLIAIFEKRKIKVILRKIGNGQVHFWSVVPAWTTNKYRDVRFVSTMKGNPEED